VRAGHAAPGADGTRLFRVFLEPFHQVQRLGIRFRLLERHGEHRHGVCIQLFLAPVELQGPALINRSRLAHGKEHIGCRVGILFCAGMGFKPPDSPLQVPVIDGIAGITGPGKAIDHVGSHEGVALVRFPPSPAAVRVMKVVEAPEPLFHHGRELLLQGGLENEELTHGFCHDDIGEESAHGLLDAAIGEAGKILEGREHACCQGGRKQYPQ